MRLPPFSFFLFPPFSGRSPPAFPPLSRRTAKGNGRRLNRYWTSLELCTPAWPTGNEPFSFKVPSHDHIVNSFREKPAAYRRTKRTLRTGLTDFLCQEVSRPLPSEYGDDIVEYMVRSFVSLLLPRFIAEVGRCFYFCSTRTKPENRGVSWTKRLLKRLEFLKVR